MEMYKKQKLFVKFRLKCMTKFIMKNKHLKCKQMTYRFPVRVATSLGSRVISPEIE